MAVITVDGLTERFGRVLVVDGLSFEVEAGTVTGFLGPNGAGKTTTLRCLLGLVVPTSGAATVLVLILDEPANGRGDGAHLQPRAGRGGPDGRPGGDRLRRPSGRGGHARRAGPRSAGEVRVRSREAERLRDVLVAGGVAARLAEPELVVATGATAHAVGQAAADSGIALYQMTSGRADLEAVFLELTGPREAQA